MLRKQVAREAAGAVRALDRGNPHANGEYNRRRSTGPKGPVRIETLAPSTILLIRGSAAPARKGR